MNEPVTIPPVIEHGGVPDIMLANVVLIVQPASPKLNPEPETSIVSPPLPLLAESTMVGCVTVNITETEP
jgi:hypothetical protein